MSKPFHVIATPDENGYTVTIPENPNVSARCADAADIVPTATAAKEQDEQNRHEKTSFVNSYSLMSSSASFDLQPPS